MAEFESIIRFWQTTHTPVSSVNVGQYGPFLHCIVAWLRIFFISFVVHRDCIVMWQRVGFLYGTYQRDEHSEYGLKALVEAIYEPPQRSTGTDFVLLPDPMEASVDRVAGGNEGAHSTPRDSCSANS